MVLLSATAAFRLLQFICYKLNVDQATECYIQWFSLPLQAILQKHCNHNVVNIVFWLASVMIVTNKPTKILAMACKMQTVTGFNLAISKLPN